jgi:peptide/nickel transport system ATP-binding protein
MRSREELNVRLPLLEVRELQTFFNTDDGVVRAVDGASFDIGRGEIVGIVGESGCGKSVTAYSILQLVSKPGSVVGGRVLYHSDSEQPPVDLAAVDPSGPEIRAIRGAEIAMIFQEPMTSFSPVHTIGFQIGRVIEINRGMDRKDARQEAIRLLDMVGIAGARQRVDAYPFQLSGGMRQRAMIAMALSCSPSLLIADEPTTALDVTTQAQIIDLLLSLQSEFGMAMMLITHDLGVVMECCDTVNVMYMGHVVESSPAGALYADPKHPYTKALFKSVPHLETPRSQRLDPIEGSVPDPFHIPSGCRFHERCPVARPGICDVDPPPGVAIGEDRTVRCVIYDQEHHS